MRAAVIAFLISMLSISSLAMSARNTRRHTQARRLSYARRHHARHRRIHLYGFSLDPALRGSHDSLLRQNEEIDRAGLPRIQDEEQLDQLRAAGELVAVQESKYLRVDPRLPEDRRYCKPWTMAFLNDLGHDYFAQFKKPIQVNSAVRTVEQQRKLRRYNRNAAPELGDTASSHLAGVTVDIAKHGMSRKEHKWVASYLENLKAQNVIEPEEERKQAVFHVMVTERYAGYRPGHEHDTAMRSQGSQAAGMPN